MRSFFTELLLVMNKAIEICLADWDWIGLAARWKCHARSKGSPGPIVFVFAASNSEQEKDEEQKDSMFASASSLMFA